MANEKLNNTLAPNRILRELDKKADKTNAYVLPVASDEALGGIKVDGNGLAVNEDGLLTLTPATVEANGAMSKEDKVLIATLVSDLAALTQRVEALEGETP